MDTVMLPEAQVEQFIQHGQTAKAAALLCKLALASAQSGDIEKSEGFRDWLYEVDDTALNQIIKINEALEAQRNKLLTPTDRSQWAPLLEKLSTEESHAFFLALTHRDVGSEKTLLKQGRPNDKLFLVQQGRLKMIYADQDKDLLIGTLGPGDIFGQETFFSVNVSTITVKTLSPVRLSYLDRPTLARIKDKDNFSEASLKQACNFGPSLVDRLRQKGLDRRSHKRFNLKTKVVFRLLCSTPIEDFRRDIIAQLWDLSKGGLSFYFSSKSRSAVRSLIGKTIGVRFGLDIGGQPKSIAVTGVVHGVESHPLDEYSVHLKLNRKFSDAALKAIRQSAH